MNKQRKIRKPISIRQQLADLEIGESAYARTSDGIRETTIREAASMLKRQGYEFQVSTAAPLPLGLVKITRLN